MAHKIVAIKMQQIGDKLVLNGMTESPRGTKVIATTFSIKPAENTKEARSAALKTGIEYILSNPA